MYFNGFGFGENSVAKVIKILVMVLGGLSLLGSAVILSGDNYFSTTVGITALIVSIASCLLLWAFAEMIELSYQNKLMLDKISLQLKNGNFNLPEAEKILTKEEKIEDILPEL